ncbi:MAG TPA: YIP1 family protein [Chloroflexaceae bacterium]|nr:YIP1 family protein [Chloroflexaceae bacterium]
MAMTNQSSLPEMVAQSREIMQSPSVPAFERYERRGTMASAAIYIGVAALVAAVIGLVGSFLPGPPAPGLGGFVGGLLSALVQFFVFTGMVYLLGKNMYRGTGTWDEVSYSFSLFTAPLIVIGALVSFVVLLFAWVPLINLLVGFAGAIVGILLLLVQVYYAYLAVQASMNLRDQTQSIVVLVLSFLATAVVMLLVGWIF